MEIYPELHRKPLNECQSGELIRLRWGSDSYALIADAEGKRFLALLSALNNTSPPRYATASPDDAIHVLSYGHEWRIDIDQGPEHVDLTASRFYEHNGVLVLEADSILLRVAPFPNLGFYHSIYFDLSAGTLVDAPKNPAAIFAKWDVSIPDGTDKFRTLISFPVSMPRKK